MNDSSKRAFKEDNNDDSVLFEEFKNGKTGAFRKLFYKFYNSMYSYGTKFSNDNELIIDTIQDVFVFLWESRNKLESVKYIKAYLFKIFRNRIFKENSKYKIRLKSKQENFNAQINFEISQEDILITEELEHQKVKLINTIFKELTSRQQEILYLKFYCNMSNVEISNLLNIEVHSVSNLLSRTIMSLRKKLKISDLFFIFNPLIISLLRSM